MEQSSASRRSFLKLGAAAGLGALGFGILEGCAAGSQNESVAAASVEDISWDGIFDVVVIGFGAAGAASAISAAETGASVLVLDKAPEGSEGGNSRFSSQIFLSAQDKNHALEYCRELNGGYSTPDDVLEAYAEGLCRIRETLVEWGLEESEILDVTDVTDDQISTLSASQQGAGE